MSECDSCGYRTKIKKFEEYPGGKVYKLCKICANTFTGNAKMYPQRYESYHVMQTIAYIGNMILDEIKALREEKK